MNGEPTARLQNALESHPSNIKYVSGDMTEGADLDKVVRETVSSYGHIDVLFNNHGVSFVVGSPLRNHRRRAGSGAEGECSFLFSPSVKK